MKTNFLYLVPIFVVLICLSGSPVFSQDLHSTPEKSNTFSLEFAPQHEISQNTQTRNTAFASGSFAYGNDIWGNDLFQFEMAIPFATNVVGNIATQSASGDFHPVIPGYMFMININNGAIVKVDVSTAAETEVVQIPVPLDGGIWSVLTIHKTTGIFYGVATDGIQSEVYQIDTLAGTATHLFSTGLPGVISGTLDGAGDLWLFEIANDSIYKLDMESFNLEIVGSAGFDGDSPQGMAYDPIEDEVYLAAYEKNVGPQLRQLNRTTGQAGFLANLPGETTAFGFPGQVAPVVQTITIPAGWSGISSFVVPIDAQMDNLMEPIVDELVLVQNQEGNIFWPAASIATLTTWNAYDGYLINASESTSLNISGTLITNPEFGLNAGWNMIPVLVSEPYAVDNLFEDVDGFVMAKEVAGTKIYWPEHGINTIGNLMPGKSYNVYTLQNSVVSF